MNDYKELIGKKIKEIRKKSNLTQADFSEIISIEPSSLSNIETGKSFPSIQTVLRIIEKFKIEPQDFFDFDYLKNEKELESDIIQRIKKLSYEKKQIIYSVVKHVF